MRNGGGGGGGEKKDSEEELLAAMVGGADTPVSAHHRGLELEEQERQDRCVGY